MDNKNSFNKTSKNIYELPFDENLDLKPEPATSHRGPMINALDFSMEEGISVYASADGVVVEVKDDSQIGGPDESLRLKGNLVRIKHDNDEYTEYSHLRYRSAKVKLHDQVTTGDLIGYSGTTGFTTYPHLHFAVYEYIEEEPGWQTLIPRFSKDEKVLTFESPDRKKE